MAPLIVNKIFVSNGEKTEQNVDEIFVKYNFDSRTLLKLIKM